MPTKLKRMLNKILSFFKNFYSSDIEGKKILDGTYFHEDFFRQVEFCPRENLELLKIENEKIRDFSEEHSDGNGLFTDVYVREETNQKSLLDKKIDASELDLTLLNLGLEKIENVYSGYGSFIEKCNDTVAYKFDTAEIFVVVENKLVKDLFINGFRFHKIEETKIKLSKILHVVGTQYDLILNDWDIIKIIDLKNRNEIKKYLNEEL